MSPKEVSLLAMNEGGAKRKVIPIMQREPPPMEVDIIKENLEIRGECQGNLRFFEIGDNNTD